MCIQPHDIDGDGRIDFALGAGWRPSDTKGPSTLQWLGRDRAGPLADPPDRIRRADAASATFGDVKGTGQKQLVVAALQGAGRRDRTGGKGRGCASSFTTFPAKPGDEGLAGRNRRSSLHTIHNLQLVDMDADRRDEIVVAAWEGVFMLDRDRAGNGPRLESARATRTQTRSKGASEVKVGHLLKDSPFIATIEPWHGFQVVVYIPPEATKVPESAPAQHHSGAATVIAEPVQWGHAVWCADLDADGR